MRGDPVRPQRHELPSPVGAHPADAALTPERRARFRQVLARRTGRLAVVIEECYDPHNATAVLRTCDAFGVHRVHVVTGRNPFRVNRRVSQGSHLRLDLRVHAEIDEAYAELRRDGYAIYVSDLRAEALVGPGELRARLDAGRLAVVFGNEGHGLSEAAVRDADGSFLLPMAGFPQSLNLSVSAAITVYRLREPELVTDAPGDLEPSVQEAFYDRWVRRQGGAGGSAAATDPRGLVTTDRRGEEVESYHADPEKR